MLWLERMGVERGVCGSRQLVGDTSSRQLVGDTSQSVSEISILLLQSPGEEAVLLPSSADMQAKCVWNCLWVSLKYTD